MKTYTLLLFSCLVALGCNRRPKEDGTTPAPLFSQPQSIVANSEGGYLINIVSGDTIQPLLTESGDSVLTGVPMPIFGKIIPDNSVSKPISYPESAQDQRVSIRAHPNVHEIPEELIVMPVINDSLTTIFINNTAENSVPLFILSSTGDTIITGVPLPIEGKVVPSVYPQPANAQPPRLADAAIANLQYLDLDQGLISSNITSILEDKRGNIWIGTQGGGVSKYDGKSFFHFTEKEGLSSNVVISMLEDKNGVLWFGTAGGVNRYDGESFTHFTMKEGLSSNTVNSIIEDVHGNLWFGMSNSGVSKYDGELITHFTENEGLIYNNVYAQLEDKNGNLWFGTYGGGVSKYDGKSFIHFTKKDGLSSDKIYSIIEDKNGDIWFGTLWGGVCKYDGESFTYITTNEGLSHNTVFSMLEDKNGNLWFSTYKGVNRYDGETLTQFTEKEGLSNNRVQSVLEDQKGNLWFGTYGGGLCKYNTKSFTHFTEKDGLGSNLILSMFEDKKSNLWFGTSGGGVSKYDGKWITQFIEKTGLLYSIIFAIIEDKNENIWFATSNGVLKYNGNAFVHFTEKEGLSNNVVLSMIEDQLGNLWFGTLGGGVNKYDGKHFTHFTINEGLSNNTITSILEDKYGNIWFGTYGGVIKYDGESITHFTEKEGLANNRVFSMFEDKLGSIWFGTLGGGISKFDGVSFTHFTVKEGLSNILVKSIIGDNDGNIWVGTENGLYMIAQTFLSGHKNKTYEAPSFELVQFVKYDGLKGINYNPCSVFLDSKNRIWWGTNKCLTMLDMNKYNPIKQPPDVYLRQLDINEQFIDYRNISDNPDSNWKGNEIAFNGVQKFENYPFNLELPYHKNHLTFHFVGIDWSAPHKIQYSYRMLGLNDNWSMPSKEDKADYRNLSYGTYTFQISAIGESGMWSEPFEYAFTINSPWWHTWWARTGYGIIAIFMLMGYVRWRTAKLKHRQRELETEVKIATKEIRKEKELSESLLLNILPAEVAEELKTKGGAEAQLIEQATVLFTDFKGFTALSEKVTPKELVADLHECFSAFDSICEKYGIEKIKTIGDAYMAAGGLPSPNTTHAQDVVKAALEMVKVVEKGKAKKIEQGLPFFEIRIGIHTGPVVAGIVGVKKFQYDIWGDTVNTASRMESSGKVGKVNISQFTYELLKDDPDFAFEHRGRISAKGKGEIEMWFVQLKK